MRIRCIIIIVILATFRASDRAQSREGDPAGRAMERIETLANDRAIAADQAIASAGLINESADARRRGNRQQALEALGRAEQLLAGAGASDRVALIDTLLRLMDEERAALNTRADTIAGPPSASALPPAIPTLAFARYRLYRESLGRILIDEQVPVELLAVALIESGFNPLALSPKGARGMWQFMPATAQHYGLAVTADDDHRTHPEHSTRAAARYLRDLYRQFGDWKLALAAYNWGEHKLQRIIAQTGIRDFDQLARGRLMPMETRKYVSAVLAVWSRLSLDRTARPTGE